MQNKRPKVVFTFVEAGFGHIMPATAICDAFEKKYGDKCEVIRWNIFSSNKNPLVQKYGNSLSNWTKKVANNKFYYLLEKFSYLTSSKLTLKIVDKKFHKEKESVMEEIKKINPDLIMSTYYSPSHFALDLKEKGEISSIVATYTPDPIVYPAWDRRSDLYFVNNDQAYDIAIKTGFKKQAVKQVPFVLRSDISSISRDKKQVRKDLGIDPNKFTVLFSNGAYGTKKDVRFISKLIEANLDINIVAICAKNKKMFDYCSSVKLPKDSKTNLYYYGITNKMFEFNSASDIFVGKCGANALAESYFFGVPTAITLHANTLEEEIAKYYVDKLGYGKQVLSPKKLVKFIKNYINDTQMQNAFSEKLKGFANSQGAEQIADILYESLQSKLNNQEKK